MNQNEFNLSERLSKRIGLKAKAFFASQNKKNLSLNSVKNKSSENKKGSNSESSVAQFLQVRSTPSTSVSRMKRGVNGKSRSIASVQFPHQLQADVTYLLNEAGLNAIEEGMREITLGWKPSRLTVAYESAEACGSQPPQLSSFQPFAEKGHSVRLWSFHLNQNSKAQKTKAKSKSAKSEDIECLTYAAESLGSYRFWSCSNEKSAALLVAYCVGQVKDKEGQNQNWYVGFYSFNPFLTQQLQQQYTFATTGMASALNAWHQKLSLPSISKKNLKAILENPQSAQNVDNRSKNASSGNASSQKKSENQKKSAVNQNQGSKNQKIQWKQESFSKNIAQIAQNWKNQESGSFVSQASQNKQSPKLSIPRRGLDVNSIIARLNSNQVSQPKVVRISRNPNRGAQDNIDFMI